jgi:NAD(P)-dependent dehydrogenase (short-subunit alcohol dehydrogenase family)
MPVKHDFSDKVCLITGAGSGIGRATAIRIASHGARLALSDINLRGVLETGSLCERPTSHMVGHLDVSISLAVTEYVSLVNTQLGRIDFLFNCAGVNPTASPLTDTTDAYWDTLVNTNLKGTYNLTRACIPHLEAAPGGAIVNVSSTLGVQAAPEYAIYCATKFGIVGFTKAMGLELGPKGVRCNAVAPGYIDTPTNAGVLAGADAVREQVGRVAMGRMGTADEVADVVAFLFSEEARYMTGAIVEITGGRA